MAKTLRALTIVACLLFSTPLWAASSLMCAKIFSSEYQNKFLGNNGARPDLGPQDPHYDQKSVIETFAHLVVRDYIRTRLENMAPGPRKRLEAVILRLKRENMSLNDLGETNRSNLLNRTTVVLNSLIENSPLYALSMAHELDHASRSITVKGRMQRYWSYKFIQNEEASAAAVEYKVLKGILKYKSVEEAESKLNDRYISNRHISVYRATWHERGWIDDAGRLTAKGTLFLNSLVSLKPEILGKEVSEDPNLKAFLTHVYDLVFLEKLKLANRSGLRRYVHAQFLPYEGDSVRHKIILGILHSNGFIALLVGLSQFF